MHWSVLHVHLAKSKCTLTKLTLLHHTQSKWTFTMLHFLPLKIIVNLLGNIFTILTLWKAHTSTISLF